MNMFDLFGLGGASPLYELCKPIGLKEEQRKCMADYNFSCEGSRLYHDKVIREQQASMKRMRKHTNRLGAIDGECIVEDFKLAGVLCEMHYGSGTIDGECSVIDVKRLEGKHV